MAKTQTFKVIVISQDWAIKPVTEHAIQSFLEIGRNKYGPSPFNIKDFIVCEERK